MIRNMPKGWVKYILKTTRQNGILSRSMSSRKGVEVIDLNLELEVGDVIEFYVEGKAKNIWVSFLWEAEVSDRRIEQALISGLEA